MMGKMSPSAKSRASEVRVRFAPSPTGSLHIGGVRTALFNWLFAKKHNGVFILRIEDTDKERSKKEYEDEIIEALRWVGLDWDEHHRQTERLDLYARHLEHLLAEGKAYYCYCTKEELEAQRQSMLAAGLAPRYSGHCRNLQAPPEGRAPQVIRFRTPSIAIEFKDMIRGTVRFDPALIDDFVIAKSVREPLYNFAVVVDDEDMHISHVIRGEEHLSNTPRQILIQHALGFGQPTYAHLPLILNAQRGKLSKREADVAVLSYREKGYLPAAIVNFLVLMGWHPAPDKETGEEKEIWTLEELVPAFDMARVQKAGAVFNEEKLDWLNREHLRRLSADEIEALLMPRFAARGIAAPASRERLHETIGTVRDRMRTLNDFFELADFLFDLPDYPASLLRWDKAPEGEAKELLEEAHRALAGLAAWDKESITAALESLIAARGKGNVLWPLRVAFSGRQSSPDPFSLAASLGKEESLGRITKAVAKLSHASLL